jgi:hypothetical protein
VAPVTPIPATPVLVLACPVPFTAVPFVAVPLDWTRFAPTPLVPFAKREAAVAFEIDTCFVVRLTVAGRDATVSAKTPMAAIGSSLVRAFLMSVSIQVWF